MATKNKAIAETTLSAAQSIESIRAAVLLTGVDGVPIQGNPVEGSRIKIKRAGKPVIPIQIILRALRAAYPDVTFHFGDARVTVIPKVS
jgi:hypothetical protein